MKTVSGSFITAGAVFCLTTSFTIFLAAGAAAESIAGVAPQGPAHNDRQEAQRVQSPRDIPAFTMITVPAGHYNMPIGRDDSATVEVPGGFMIGETEVTYALWYAVRIWAEAHGYHFQHLGTEGSNISLISTETEPGVPGAPPTVRKREPVTHISWRDVVVWCNALSEMEGREPVYRTPEGIIVRDSRDLPSAPLNQDDIETVLQTDHDGYRLPTDNEWELAARYIDGTNWTPGNYASGATDSTDNWLQNLAATWNVAVFGFRRPPGSNLERRFGVRFPAQTAEVASKAPNALGIYDMSGNVWEWTFTASERQPFTRGRRGGDWYDSPTDVAVGSGLAGFYTAKLPHITGGFRLAKDKP